MDTYTVMRHFADSWMLMAMFGFFVAAVLWAFRPGSATEHDDISQIPFRHEDRPADDRPAVFGGAGEAKEARQ